MGLWSIATTLPGIIAPFVGAVVLNIAGLAGYTALGYRLVFTLAVALLLLGAVWVLMVRNQLSPPGVDQQAGGSPAGQSQFSKRPVRQGWRLAFQTRSGRARGFLRFWPFWESVTIAFHPQQRIPDAPFDLLRIQFTHFHGRAITLPDGTSIRSGDRIAELHINNRAMAEVAQRVSSWQLLRMLMGDLESLARWSQSKGFPEGIRAYYGYTLLSRGASRLGFTLRSRPRTLRSWLDGFFMLGLLVLYSPLGRGRLLRGTTYGRQPIELWMSPSQLALRYSRNQRDSV
jgi:hypothetical protein